MKSLGLFFLIAFATTSALAQGWHEKGKSVPDNKWRQSDGTFGVMQLLTSKPGAFLKNWNIPSEGVGIALTNKITRGRPIVSFVVFQGCQANANNNCDLKVAMKVLDPSGKTYAETGRLELWMDKPKPPKGAIQLGVNYLVLIIEPQDRLGEYQIYATVWDLNSGKQLSTIQRFTAVEAEK